MIKFISTFLVVIVPVVTSSGLYGWTTSGVTQQNSTDCLQNKNDAQFALFTGMYYADVSEEICGELSMAAKSNIPHRDVLFSPCPTCTQSAAGQIDKLVSWLNSTCTPNTWSGRLWLDMKSHGYWPTPWREAGYIKNQEWFNDMVDACTSNPGVACGIYSDITDYKYIVGSDDYVYAPAAALPLWYSSIDNVASFDNFLPFGGFTKPYAKEYAKLAYGECGTPYLYEDWAPVW